MARRLSALDEFVPEYEAEHGEVTTEEMGQAAQRLRARGRGKQPGR